MKINMADVNAAIGLAQIREYPELLKERKRVFNAYSDAFSACDWAIVPPSVDGEKESSYHIYALRIKDFTEEQRDRMIDEIAKVKWLSMCTLYRCRCCRSSNRWDMI